MTEDATYMNTLQAARYLGLSDKTLRRYRVSGDGPVFCRFNTRIRYRREDLDDWAATRRQLPAGDPGSGACPPGSGAGTGERDPVAAAGDGTGDRPGPALRCAAVAMFAAAAVLAGADAAWATTDTTFDSPLDTVEGIVGGTGGQLAAALAVGAALVGSVLRFNAMQLMGAVGVGIAAGAGTGIVTGLVGTAII